VQFTVKRWRAGEKTLILPVNRGAGRLLTQFLELLNDGVEALAAVQFH
jgi:hypothetical protein